MMRRISHRFFESGVHHVALEERDPLGFNATVEMTVLVDVAVPEFPEIALPLATGAAVVPLARRLSGKR